ncbi:MAG: endonuclease domain-containing protein [Paludibacteraceae bacterium]|nr:endonuclease domain-containing protein [Paludibacteraceae bacterium]
MKTPPSLPSREEKKYVTARTYAYDLLKQNARSMRINPTEAEYVLWKYLRNKQLGHRFRRQQIVDDYIVDFVCLEKQLVIEVDGKYHADGEQRELDALREDILISNGYRIIRFTNEEVTNNIDQVIENIKKLLI